MQTNSIKVRFTGIDTYETFDEYIEELGRCVPCAFVQPGVDVPEELLVHFIPTNGTYH